MKKKVNILTIFFSVFLFGTCFVNAQQEKKYSVSLFSAVPDAVVSKGKIGLDSKLIEGTSYLEFNTDTMVFYLNKNSMIIDQSVEFEDCHFLHGVQNCFRGVSLSSPMPLTLNLSAWRVILITEKVFDGGYQSTIYGRVNLDDPFKVIPSKRE